VGCKLKTFELEKLLSTEEYAPVKTVKRWSLNDIEGSEWDAVENVPSFGTANIYLFDEMVAIGETLPTQKDYVSLSVERMANFIRQNYPEVELTPIGIEAMIQRSARTYKSNITEIHLLAMMDEILPKHTVMTSPMIDSVLGVDLIVEDMRKRYYVHVTSASKQANKMLKQKESRGGSFKEGKFIRFKRDFTGDMILRYSGYSSSFSTKLINEYPLFREIYILKEFRKANNNTLVGENILHSNSKLERFKRWARNELQVDIGV